MTSNHYIRNCTVTRSELEQLATEIRIEIQNQDDPRSYCGLAAQYFLYRKIITLSDEKYSVHILIPKEDLKLYLIPHTLQGEPMLESEQGCSAFLRRREEIHRNLYLGMTIDIPVSDDDLCGKKRDYECRGGRID